MCVIFTTNGKFHYNFARCGGYARQGLKQVTGKVSGIIAGGVGMTIKDIAKLGDVSVSTVSRVLNDRPDVSEDSADGSAPSSRTHRYALPNNSARDLVKIRSDAVGLVVRGVQNPLHRHHPRH